MQYDNIKRGVEGTLQKVEHARRQLMEKSNELSRDLHQIEQYWNQYESKTKQITRKFEQSKGFKSGGAEQGRGIAEALGQAAKDIQREMEQSEREYVDRVRSLVADIERTRSDIGRISI